MRSFFSGAIISTGSVRTLMARLTFTKLSAAQFRLLLAALDLVAHSVELVALLALLRQPRSRTLASDPVVARRSHLAVHDGPDFLHRILACIANQEERYTRLCEIFSEFS